MVENRTTLLLVDDSPLNLCVLKEVISEYLPRCELLTASGAGEALSMAESRDLDGVITDVQMPEIGGIELCRRLKLDRRTAGVPVILVTSHLSTSSLRAEGIEAGADDFISRPVDNVELIARIKAMLRVKRGEDRLRRSNALLEKRIAEQTASLREYRKAVESSPDLVAKVGADYRYLVVNEAFARYNGISAEEIVGKSVGDLFGEEVFETEIKPRLELCLAGETVEFETTRNYPEKGTSHVLKIYSPLMGEDGRIEAVVAITRDITESKRSESRLREKEEYLNYLTHYDSLTGLPNRTFFRDRVEKLLAEANSSKRKVAVLVLDLDRFKLINESLGHGIGDRVLHEVVERLRHMFSGVGVPARLEGDAFGVILEEFLSLAHVEALARKVLAVLAQAIIVDEHRLFVTASMGISFSASDSRDSEALLARAEVAMSRAKKQGGSNYQIYTPEMNFRAQEMLLLEGCLHQALELEQLTLHYQPQIDVLSGNLVGMEALLRWRHPELGLVPPGDFIPLAEESGLIVPIGEWVLRTACRQAKLWLDAGLPLLRMAVNISARQFREPDFVSLVDIVLAETELDPTLLELEITESIVMDDVETAIMTLTDLRARGIYLSIDDFGTGFSSLNYLKRFPISKLKIDRSFVTSLPEDENDAAIVDAIIALARSMRLEVIAEGVETEKQLKFLMEKGCTQVQGFLFGRPLPPEELSGAWADPLGREALAG